MTSLVRVVALGIAILGVTGCGAGPKEAPPPPAAAGAEFSWSAPGEPYLVQLKAEFGLAEVVAGATDKFGVVQRLSGWTRSRWEHDGWAEPEKSDPLSILREAAAGKRFRCVEYGAVLAGALTAVGVRARTLGLMTRDVETRESGAGHVAVEAFLDDLGKWIMIDPQWDAIPTRGGVPLNARELGRALEAGEPGVGIISSSGTSPAEYLAWIREYLFYLTVSYDNRYPEPASFERLMLVPDGAPNPAVFQIAYPIQGTTFTRSEEEFYAAPPRPDPAF
jgi:hypothetical protein